MYMYVVIVPVGLGPSRFGYVLCDDMLRPIGAFNKAKPDRDWRGPAYLEGRVGVVMGLMALAMSCSGGLWGIPAGLTQSTARPSRHRDFQILTYAQAI